LSTWNISWAFGIFVATLWPFVIFLAIFLILVRCAMKNPAALLNVLRLFLLSFDQGCQMVSFQTKNPNLGKFCRALAWKKFWYSLWPFWIFYGHFVHFLFIWYIFPYLGTMYQEKSGNPGFDPFHRRRCSCLAMQWSGQKSFDTLTRSLDNVAPEWGQSGFNHAGLPDGIFSNQKFPIWVNFGGPWNENVWYILWPFEKKITAI
jgi:hypothetical protein